MKTATKMEKRKTHMARDHLIISNFKIVPKLIVTVLHMVFVL